jgi:hypothetical protein
MKPSPFSRLTASWLIAASASAVAAAPAPVDLSRPFGIAPGWQLLSHQGPAIEDAGGDPAPGALHLCITHDHGRTCRPRSTTCSQCPATKAFSTQPII